MFTPTPHYNSQSFSTFPQLYVLFLIAHGIPLSAAHTLTGVGPSTGLWLTWLSFPWKPPAIKSSSTTCTRLTVSFAGIINEIFFFIVVLRRNLAIPPKCWDHGCTSTQVAKTQFCFVFDTNSRYVHSVSWPQILGDPPSSASQVLKILPHLAQRSISESLSYTGMIGNNLNTLK